MKSANEEKENDDFIKFMAEIEEESRESAKAYFEELYETSHGCGGSAAEDGDYDEFLQEFEGDSSEDEKQDYSRQRKGNLNVKLAASPDGDFPISPYSLYKNGRWVLLEAGQFTEISIIIDNSPEDLQPLKRAISYYLLPATNPFGTIRSFVSSQNYADSFKHIQTYVFEANHLDGSAESISIIGDSMLNEALDTVKREGSPHAYNMMFFYINFWLTLSSQGLLPPEYSLKVDASLVDTASRRQDVLDVISSAFVGWKPYSEDELITLLGYAFFWIDEAMPLIVDAKNYLELRSLITDAHCLTSRPDPEFESVLGKKVKGVEVLGFGRGKRFQLYKMKSGERRKYVQLSYTWRLKYKYAIDRVRNAVFILFCLMTGMRRKELAPLKFSDVIKGKDSVWRVYFSRYKTSSDPNYHGDPDFITIPDYLGEAIETFESLRKVGNNYLKGYIFQPALGNVEMNLTDRMIDTVARNVARETGLPQLHVHRFRKTIAELLIHESEANIDVIRMIFGHSSYVMTLRYIARNPFIVSSVVETLREHFAEDFVNVVQAIHTGVYAGEAAHRIATQVESRPEYFGGTVLKTTIMQYVSHLLEGGSVLRIQRTSLGTMCLSHRYDSDDDLPPCLKSRRDLIFPTAPDFSSCHIQCEHNIILQGSKDAIEHNLKFYRSLLINRERLKLEAVSEIEDKIDINERLLRELTGRVVSSEATSSKNLNS